MTVPRLSAGVITADLTRLGAELEILCGKAAWAHVDVMDGAFCPQLTVGPAFAAANSGSILRGSSTIRCTWKRPGICTAPCRR